MEFTGKTHTHTLIFMSFLVKQLVRPKTPWKISLPHKGRVQQLWLDMRRKRNSMATSVLCLLSEFSLGAADPSEAVAMFLLICAFKPLFCSPLSYTSPGQFSLILPSSHWAATRFASTYLAKLSVITRHAMGDNLLLQWLRQLPKDMKQYNG